MEKLIVLGTGTALVTNYYNTCFALFNGDEYLLVDGGGGDGIFRQFKKAGISWGRVHHIYVTHEHTDHLLGIICALRMILYRMDRGAYKGSLKLYASPELLEKIKTICRMTLRSAERSLMGTRIEWQPVEDGVEKTVMGFKVQFFDIYSTKALQFGFLLHLGNGKTLSCLGDEPCPLRCEQYVYKTDWLLSEAFCLYSQRDIYHPYQYHHSTVKDACMLAERCEVNNLVLWHTEEDTYGQRKKLYMEEGKRYYRGNLYIPDDLEEIVLS